MNRSGAKLVVVCVAGLAGVARAQTADYAAWNAVWSDEFNGTSLDGSKWFAQNVAWPYNSEQEYYRPQNVTIANGICTITAKKETFGGRPYTSGRIETGNSFTPMYGRFEFRAKLPKGQGMWPALWFCPTNTWPPEIDLMENLGNDTHTIYFTNHWGTSANHQDYSTNWYGPDFSADFHIFTLEWWPERLDFYVDNVLRSTHHPSIPRTPMAIIMNVAVGGDWGGYPDSSTVFPQTMQIDYVRAFSRYLVNESFEDPGPGQGMAFYSWTPFGNAFIDSNAPRTGNRSAKFYGNFTGSFNNSGAYQEIPASVGQQWRARGWWMNRTSDPMQGANSTVLNIEWHDATGKLISYVSAPGIDATSPRDAYQESEVIAIAPPGTAKARIVPIFYQPAMAAGAAWFDDAEMALVNPCPADFNGDQFVDFFDFQEFVDCFESGNCSSGTTADFNGDGFVDFFDFSDFVDAFENGC